MENVENSLEEGENKVFLKYIDLFDAVFPLLSEEKLGKERGNLIYRRRREKSHEEKERERR